MANPNRKGGRAELKGLFRLDDMGNKGLDKVMAEANELARDARSRLLRARQQNYPVGPSGPIKKKVAR